MRILIAEDEAAHRRLLALILNEHDVIEARNGAEAVELAQCCQPDVVLMDVAMPGMDGFEALAELQADARTALIPVIMISAGYTRKKDVERGRRLGAVDHIEKPFNIDALRAKVKSYAKKEEAWDGTQALQLQSTRKGASWTQL